MQVLWQHGQIPSLSFLLPAIACWSERWQLFHFKPTTQLLYTNSWQYVYVSMTFYTTLYCIINICWLTTRRCNVRQTIQKRSNGAMCSKSKETNIWLKMLLSYSFKYMHIVVRQSILLLVQQILVIVGFLFSDTLYLNTIGSQF